MTGMIKKHKSFSNSPLIVIAMSISALCLCVCFCVCVCCCVSCLCVSLFLSVCLFVALWDPPQCECLPLLLDEVEAEERESFY